MKAFEAFGQLASVTDDSSIISGRHPFHDNLISLIVNDIKEKMELKAQHRLLEIGCGVGMLLNPLSQYVAQAVGIDHAEVIARYHQKKVPKNVVLLAGEWPKVSLHETFDSILIYSVMHYIANARAADQFIDACLKHLAPAGRVLIGDIPNHNKWQRFQATSVAKRISTTYLNKKTKLKNRASDQREKIFSRIEILQPFLNDTFVLKLMGRLRQRGYETFLLPQNKLLPFSYTREDILIIHPGI